MTGHRDNHTTQLIAHCLICTATIVQHPDRTTAILTDRDTGLPIEMEPDPFTGRLQLRPVTPELRAAAARQPLCEPCATSARRRVTAQLHPDGLVTIAFRRN